MPYISTIKNTTFRIETDEENRSITLDGRLHAIDWQQLTPLAADAKGLVGVGGRYSLLLGGRSYEIFARRITKADETDHQTYEILLEGQRFEVKVEDERAKLLAGIVKGAATSGVANVQSPMPGLVAGTPVEVGASVTAGQTVIILEAMKMENDLASPIAGIVREVRVSKGQTVEQGAVLIVIEAQKEE